jgi:NAD(P)-dependent dehydrogenase (short-subunit alcohol dehydrogenase family)
MYFLLEFLNNKKFEILGLFALTSSLYLLKYKYMGGKTYESKVTLDDKIVIVTGANSGIGFETALDLSKRKAHVILACRDMKKAQKSLDMIKKISKNRNVYVEKLDLASFESVKDFSNRILSKYDKIDILINNAGVAFCPKWLTQNNFEYQFQVNYLSHYLLTRLLLDKLVESSSIQSPTRVINVTSILYKSGRIDWDDINFNSHRKYDSGEAYKQSKLCNILFTSGLNEYVNSHYKNDEKKINAYSVSPGIVLTNLGQHSKNSSISKKIAYFLFYPLIWFLMKTPKQGAQSLIFCAVESNLKQIEGKMIRNMNQIDLNPNAKNKDDAIRLWNLSEKFIKNWI